MLSVLFDTARCIVSFVHLHKSSGKPCCYVDMYYSTYEYQYASRPEAGDISRHYTSPGGGRAYIGEVQQMSLRATNVYCSGCYTVRTTDQRMYLLTQAHERSLVIASRRSSIEFIIVLLYTAVHAVLYCSTYHSGEHNTSPTALTVIDPTAVVDDRAFVTNRKKTLKMKYSPVIELACARELPGYGLGLKGVSVNAMMRHVKHPYHSSAHEPPKPCDTFRRTSHGLQSCIQAVAVAYQVLYNRTTSVSR